MKLFYSPFHSFTHKTLVVAHEAGLWDEITRVPSFPFRNLDKQFVTGKYDLSPIAPLGKVPCLATEDGTVLYGSQTVTEYLDHRGSNTSLYPPTGPRRWDALRRMALGDSVFEFAVQLSMEAWVGEPGRRKSLFQWLWPKICASLDYLETSTELESAFDIGSVAMLQGLSYLAGRADSTPDDPVHPNFNWRQGRPRLSRWYDKSMTRPSVTSHFEKEYVGDLSPANHQRHVDEVLAAQRVAQRAEQ